MEERVVKRVDAHTVKGGDLTFWMTIDLAHDARETEQSRASRNNRQTQRR